jgi:small subunit ribosomal protein S21
MRDDKYNKYDRHTKQAPKGGDTESQVVSVPVSKQEPVMAQPLEVKVYGNNFDKAMRAFRAKVQKERILSEFKERQSYEKPSDKKRRKRSEMKRKKYELDHPREKTERPAFKKKFKDSDE